MSRPPTPAAPPDEAAEADRQLYRQVVHDLMDLGMDLARAAHAEAKERPTPEALAGFDRVARTVRRTVLLAKHLGEAPRRPTRTEARQQIIRGVEDRIGAHMEEPLAETLRAEFAERLDSPELEADLRRRPVPDIIQDICQDLGIENYGGATPFCRRTPADITHLLARAARPSRATPKPAVAPVLLHHRLE